MTAPGSTALMCVPFVIGSRYGFTGPALSLSTACASGAHAVCVAAALIRDGAADAIICVGVDALVNEYVADTFARLGALSRSNECRPFDVARDGLVLAEGAAALVVSRRGAFESHATARLRGWAMSADAFGMATPAPDGSVVARTIVEAMARAGCAVADLAHINAHGTGTIVGDLAEARAIRSAFGDAIPPVFSLKGQFGHLMGAAGLLELIASVEGLRCGCSWGTSGLASPDPAIEIPIADRVVRSDKRMALSNSFGFGGHNAVVVLEGCP